MSYYYIICLGFLFFFHMFYIFVFIYELKNDLVDENTFPAFLFVCLNCFVFP